MQVSTSVDIDAPRAKVWAAISDVENSPAMISAIIDLTVLEKPEAGLVGLKWTATRKIFGKEADETMWITDVVEEDHYNVRAESHGAIYKTRMAIEDVDGGI